LYSSLQQQCLVELGVIPYDLNDKYQQSNDGAEVQKPSSETAITSEASIQTQIPVTRPKPSLKTAPLNTTSLPAEPVAPAAIDYWAQCSAEFITDLKVVFPEVKLSVPAFGSLLAQLSEHVFWKVAPKMQAQYVQMESIEQSTVITSPLPSELMLSQKKELWLLLQPHAPQPAQTNQATQTIREN